MTKSNSTQNNGKIVKSNSNKIEAIKSGYLSRALELLQNITSSKISATTSSNIEQKNAEDSSLISQFDNGRLTLDIDQKYSQLNHFLTNKQWLDADNETKRIIMSLCGRQRQDWVRVKDLKRLPCKDLETIDQLWVEYSSNHFGISIQRELFKKFWDGGQSVDYHSRWCKFGESVGWRKDGLWTGATDKNDGWLGSLEDEPLNEDKQFSKPQEAKDFPVGHFPRICRLRVGGLVWWAGAPRFPWGTVYCALMLRSQQCHLVQK